jgi:hypothetical protein
MYRETIIECEDYTCELSYDLGEVFIHLDVRNYNKTIFKKMKEDWDNISEALYLEGFERVLAIPEKAGLVNKLGWTHIDNIEFEGNNIGVYLWELQPR